VLGAISSISSVFLYGYPTSSAANISLAVIRGVVGLFGFVGFILFLISMYGFSRDYNEQIILNYILYGFLCNIVASIIAVAIVVVIFLFNLSTIFPNLNQTTTTPSQVSTSMLTSISPFLAVFSFVGVIWVVFNVLAFRLLAEKSGVPLFRTGASVLLAGAVVNVGVGILLGLLMYGGSIDYQTFLLAAIPGGLMQDVAWVLLAMSFFRIKVPPFQPISLSSVATAAGQIMYCQNCGTPNQMGAVFCSRCGQKL
jgi:uncharacterized membrane protein